MTGWLAVAGAAVAWLGVATVTLSDERRGLALGLAVTGAGLAAATAAAGHDGVASAALALGGVCSAAGHLGGGARRWGIMPPGSTPRLIGCVIALIVTVLVLGTSLQDPAGVARVGAVVVSVVAAGRVLTVGQSWAALGAGSALTLGLGGLGSPRDLFLGAAVAASLGLIGLAGRQEVPV